MGTNIKIQKSFPVLRFFIAFLLFISFNSVFSHGDLHELIESITKKIEKFPDSAELYIIRADYFRLHKEFDKALNDVNTSVSKNKNIDTRIINTLIFIDCNKTELADSCITSFLSENNFHKKALTLKVEILKKKQNFKEAILFQNKIIKNANEQNPEDYYEFINLYKPLYKNWIDSVFNVYNYGRKQLGNLPFFDEFEFDISINNNRLDNALEVCDRSIKIANRKEFWYSKKASVYKLIGETKNEKRYLHLVLVSIDSLPKNTAKTRAVKELKFSTEKRLKEITE